MGATYAEAHNMVLNLKQIHCLRLYGRDGRRDDGIPSACLAANKC